MTVHDTTLRPAPATSIGVGVHDALTARMVQSAGFDLLWLGSLEVCSRFAIPDRNLLTPTEMTSVIREVKAATTLPVYVDADNGYGSDLTAARAVRAFEDAGAHTVVIEDNVFPKRNSLAAEESRDLMDTEEFARRLERVTAERKNLRIVARCEALVAGLGVDEAVRRMRRYAETGVDGLFVQVNKKCKDQLFPALEQVRGLLPITLAPTSLPEVPLETFAEYGATTVLFANVVVRRMLATLPGMLATLRDECLLSAVEPDIAPVEQVLRMTDERVG
ncbi:isocitrate lyase/phosphoenolpyruvate mutase family protein [Streptomyces sp. NPDC001034]|uniref:isocitrate lyase/phosphoenolpyruvate mutase family protein n=1 Tax=Streptomyces sp. NPDC001034 TaxID=3154375 RepID=UPI00332E80EA